MTGRTLALLLLFAPIVLYAAIQFARRRGGEDEVEILSSERTLLLIAAGVGLAGAALIIFGLQDRGGTSSHYEPARYIDGELVPGRID